jgi:UDP-N-acetylmuramate dehydrogenase
MVSVGETSARLAAIPDVTVKRDAPLSAYTRFGIGGPADVYVETGNPESFVEALRMARESGIETIVIGGGTNLIVSDE